MVSFVNLHVRCGSRFGAMLFQQSSELLKIVDDLVRTLAAKKVFGKRSGYGDDAASCGLPGEDSGERIFNDDAVVRIGVEVAQGDLKNFRVWLGAREAGRIHNEIESVGKAKHTESCFPISAGGGGGQRNSKLRLGPIHEPWGAIDRRCQMLHRLKFLMLQAK